MQIATWPQAGGIIYGANYERSTDDYALTAAMVRDIRKAIVGEGQVYSFPALISTIRNLNPSCEIGLEISAWGAWKPPGSVYWPLRTAFGVEAERNDWWLRYADGTPVIGSTGLCLVDLTIPRAADWYIGAVRAQVARIGPDFIFWDECHSTLNHLPNADEIRLRAEIESGQVWTREQRNAAWTRGQTKQLRYTGGGQVNGTIRQADAPVVISGRYIQKALFSVQPDGTRVYNVERTIVTATEHIEARDEPNLILEQPCDSVTDQIHLVSLASRLGGLYQITPPVGWSVPLPQPIRAGVLGEALSPYSGIIRQFANGSAYGQALRLGVQ